MDIKPWYLKHTQFSELLSTEDKMTFMQVCPEKPFRKGDYVFRVGDPATDLHIIARGQIKLVTMTPSGQERILAILGPDDFMGEAFLKDQSHYLVDAIALTEVSTCPISRSQFMQLSTASPHFTLIFTEIVISHLFSCREQLSVAYEPVKTRIAKLLVDQARRFGKPLDDEWYELNTELRHEEIASYISTTRVSVTMTLSELREEGLIEGTRGAYRINIPAFLSIASD